MANSKQTLVTWLRDAHAMERASVDALLNGAGLATRAAVVVGSVIDPATVGNQHIRAHANEGRLFRVVLCDALESRGVKCEVIVEKPLKAAAAKRLARTPAQIARIVVAFGNTLGKPWRGEEKAAAIAAWMAQTC